jgi:hypothetical protein
MKSKIPAATLSKSVLIISSLFIIFYFSSCAKKTELSVTQGQTVDTTITDTTVYLDITLNGSRLLGVQNTSGGPYYWSTVAGLNPVDNTTYGYNRIGSVFTYEGLSAYPAFAFGMGNYNNWLSLYYYNTLSPNFIDSFFAPGNYTYSILTHDTTISYLGSSTDTVIQLTNPFTGTLLSPGVNLLWNDNTGTIWETFKGTADQTGSYFTITSVQPLHSTPPACLVTASFACKLYDNGGQVIILTTGKGRFMVYL